MKILHIISSGGMYGAEAVILNLSNSLERSGHRSSVGVFSTDPHQPVALHAAALAAGIPSHLIPCTGQLDLSVPSSIRALARETGADVVHAHGYKADIYTWLALRRSSIPLVSTCHTWYDNDVFVRLYGAADRHILRQFSGIVAVSEEVKRRLLASGVPAAKIALIRNGIGLESFTDGPRNSAMTSRPLHVGLVGRLAPEKGVDLFLRAAAQVLAVEPSTTFTIVGDGPDRGKLAALLEQLGLSGKISMPGHAAAMPSVYASLDLLVSSSRQEGLPIALLEGMASALPVVATRVGAVPTAVQEGVTGLLVPPEDVSALAVAMLSLLKNPLQRVAFGQAGRRRVQTEFSATRMADDYLALYRKVSACSAGCSAAQRQSA